MAFHDWKPKPWLSKSMVLLWIWYGFTWFSVYLLWNPLPLAPCNLPLAPWHWPMEICTRTMASHDWNSKPLLSKPWFFWSGYVFDWCWPLLVWNLTLTPCNLQRAMGTFGIETWVFWFLLLSNHVASFWVKVNLPRPPKNSITWMQWPLLIRKPIAYKPEIDPRHVRTEVGLNQAHLNSCQNSAFLCFGDFLLMLDLPFVCLYQYLFDSSPSNFFWWFLLSMLYMGELNRRQTFK